MQRFQSILFSADFSEGSRAAFRVACSLARENEGRLVVLHVLEFVHVAEEAVYFGPEGEIKGSRGEGDLGFHEAIRDRLRRTYVPDRAITTEYLVREGTPAETILSAAVETGCDLIALGTHGRTGLLRALTGSVAEAVLRSAPCPVLALRAPAHGEAPAPEIRAILAATDDSEPSREAVSVARELAVQLGARLVLLHVEPLDTLIPGEIPMPLDLGACRAALDTARHALDGPDLKAPIEIVLRQGDTATQIIDAASATKCDLVVIGTHGRSGFSRLLLGSVAEAVLRRSHGPVLAVKSMTANRKTGVSEKVDLAVTGP